MRKISGVIVVFFLIFLAFGIYGAADNTTNGLPPMENGQVDPLVQEFWKVYLLGSVLYPVLFWFSNYNYTRAETMSIKSDVFALVSGTSFIFGVWCWAGTLGYVGLWAGIAAGVVAIVVGIVIFSASTVKALNDQHRDYLANSKQ